jgi:hypothetical protein
MRIIYLSIPFDLKETVTAKMSLLNSPHKILLTNRQPWGLSFKFFSKIKKAGFKSHKIYTNGMKGR